jgi:3-oxoacyl-[acyl-carrier protein] reductase
LADQALNRAFMESLGRVGKPRDVAAAVAYAVSEGAAWVTGTTLDVAGGMVF